MDITEDQTSPEQLRESFRGIAEDKVCSIHLIMLVVLKDLLQPFVTELDMRLAQLPVSAIDYLREVLPSSKNEVGELEYDYERWLHDVFT